MRIGVAVAATVLVVLASGPALAQGVSGGVKVGVGIAELHSEDEDLIQLQSRRGLVAGGFVDIPVHETFAIAIEALFTQKGASDSIEEVELTTELDYIEFPVLAKAPFNTMGTVQPFVYGGVAPAINTSAQFSGEIGGESEEVDIGEEFKAFDLGLVVGGGVKFGILGVEVRYNHGIVNISEFEDEESITNRQTSVLVSVQFGGP